MKSIKRFKTSIVILFFTILLVHVVKHNHYVYDIYHIFSKKLIDIISFLTSFTCLAVWDYLVIFLIIVFLFGLYQLIFKKAKLLNFISIIVLTISIIISSLTTIFFANHYQPSLSIQLGEEIIAYNVDELYMATEYYLNQASQYVLALKRDDSNNPIKDDFYELAKLAGESYATMDNPIFQGNTITVKQVSILGNYLLYNGITGIFIPLTGEASVPKNVDNVSICFTMVHEVAHRLTIASEQDANYAAFLACTNNEDQRFKYSGYYMAFRYCFTKLRNTNTLLSQQLIDKYKHSDNFQIVFDDYNYYIDYYQQYESFLSKLSDKANDTYLKIFGQQDGSLSYGSVADNLVTYYLNNN